MDGIKALNSLLDETINSVLEDAADKFHLRQDSLRESDFEKYMEEDEQKPEVPWNQKSNYQTPQSDQYQYHDPKTQQTQFQYSRNDKPEYHETPRSAQAHYPPETKRTQFQTPRTDQPQYQVPRKEQLQYQPPDVGHSQFEYTKNDQAQYQERNKQTHYNVPRNDQTQYQVPINDQTQSQTPRTNQSQYQNTENDVSQYYPPRVDQSQYQYSRNGQPPYEASKTDHSQYQAPRRDKSQYQPTNTNKTETQWKPENQRINEKNFRSSGKTQNTIPPFSNQTQEDNQESFQEKYERFRSQMKNQNIARKQVSCQEIHRKEERPETSYRPPSDTPQSPEDRVEVQPSPPREKEEGIEESEDQLPDEVEKPPIVTRGMWGALPTLDAVPQIETPADTVVFSFNTGTSPCDTPKECMRRVRETQAKNLGEGLADIQYSFLLGGDGYIYEGRGWDYESGVKRAPGEGPNLNIGFIGNYKNDTKLLPKHMVNNAQHLLLYSHSVGLLKGTNSRTEIKEPKKAALTN